MRRINLQNDNNLNTENNEKNKKKSGGFFVSDETTEEFIDREVHEDNKIFHFRIFYIENKNIIAAVIEDITAPGIRKNRIITQAQKVIDKNLEVVQKIAFLLGENAAETEAMLNSIIESYGN